MTEEAGVRLAIATIDDLEDVLPLVTAYRIFYQRPPDREGERAYVTRNLSERRSTIVLARDAGGEAVGFMQLFQTYSTVWLRPSLILEDLFVKPEARRRGTATKLLEHATEFARQIGAVGMFLETAIDNKTAQGVYARAGWTREGRFYKYNATL